MFQFHFEYGHELKLQDEKISSGGNKFGTQ